MFDFEIAYCLYKISKILAVFEDNKYKSEAYFKAAMAIDAYNKYTEELVEKDKLTNIDGIGESSSKLIKEILRTNKCVLLSDLEKKYNITDYSLLLSYGLNNKLTKKLFDNGISTFDELKLAVRQNKTDFLTNAEKNNIQSFIEQNDKIIGQYLFSYAYCLCNELISLINLNEADIIAEFANTWQEKTTSGKIHCLNNYKQKVLNIITKSERYTEIEVKDSQIFCTSQFGLPIEIHFVSSLSLKKHKKLLRGDLHMHTTWSDGKHSIDEMAEYAKKLGHEYIGITDHSYSLRVANGISEVDAKQQIEQIKALKNKGVKILAGIEVEVLKDGSLDYSDALLSQFDYCIAGIHTHLNQLPSQLYERIEKALSNPYINIFAHPTSRLLGRPGVLFSERSTYAISTEQIMDICKRNNVAIEFNSFPERFDIPTEFFKKIKENDIMLSVGTDSHSTAHLNCIEYAEMAISTFPKIKSNLLNTFSANKLLHFFSSQRISKNAVTIDEDRIVTKNFDFFFGTNKDIMLGNKGVIGIDLTGSENKPSGFAVMYGKNVKTDMLYSDEDLIQASLKHNPSVVSIDSPLSYPAGRCCAKSTCDCKKYGITRYCERLLSSFGIGVYPCLIPSMVNLTTRGMRLAQKFRDLGIDVIESYPGVAQDILNIRRKQNGLEHLKNGYKNFGIVGDYFSSEAIKHDELDAIASALVGLFYINGQYVALGNDAENYLIVPCVVEQPTKPIVLGLTGGIGAGKTTLAEYLKFKYGFKTLRYSQVICDLYDCDNSRSTLQTLGAEIARDSEKQKSLSLAIIKRIEENPNFNYVIDGLRHQIDFDTLKDHFGNQFDLLYIDINFNNAHKHYNKRINANISEEEFRAILENESEQDIFILKFLTNCNVIENNKTYKDFFEAFENYYKEILCQ